MAETGTETSCLRLAPWWRCASGTDSRSFHMACDWASEVASMASAMTPRAGRVLQSARSTSAEQILLRIGRGQLDEQVPGRTLIQRIGDARDVLDGELDGQARHQFEGGELIAGRRAQARQQIQRMPRRLDADQRGGGVRRQREQLQSTRR